MLRLVIAGVIVLVSILAMLAGDAWGHGPYEPSCCSDRDCAPVADDVVTETPAGFRLNDTGEFVARASSKVRRPLNEEYHLCRNSAGALLCIYPKYQGN